MMHSQKEENAFVQVIFKLHNNGDNICGEKKVSGIHLEMGHLLFLRSFFEKDREITS